MDSITKVSYPSLITTASVFFVASQFVPYEYNSINMKTLTDSKNLIEFNNPYDLKYSSSIHKISSDTVSDLELSKGLLSLASELAQNSVSIDQNIEKILNDKFLELF